MGRAAALHRPAAVRSRPCRSRPAGARSVVVARRFDRLLAEPVEAAASARPFTSGSSPIMVSGDSFRPRTGFPRAEDRPANIVRCRKRRHVMRSMILISAAALAVASCTDQPVAPNDTAAFARQDAGREAAGLEAGMP